MKLNEKISELEEGRKNIIEMMMELHSTTREQMDNISDQLRLYNFTLRHLKEIDKEKEDDYSFDVDEYVKKNMNDGNIHKPMGVILQEVQRRILTKIINIRNTKNARNIVTSGKLAAFIQDMAGYTLEPIKGRIKEQLEVKETPYPMSQISDILLYVDPFMKWTDNRIRFYVDDDFKPEKEVCYLKVKDSNDYLI